NECRTRSCRPRRSQTGTVRHPPEDRGDQRAECELGQTEAPAAGQGCPSLTTSPQALLKLARRGLHPPGISSFDENPHAPALEIHRRAHPDVISKVLTPHMNILDAIVCHRWQHLLQVI